MLIPTRRTPVISALVFTALLSFTIPAAAQQPTPPSNPAASPGEFTVTPFIGFGFSGDLDGATGVLGVAAGYVWSDRVSIEAEYSLLPSSENTGLVEVDSTVWNLTANMLYRFGGREGWVPYGAVGIGFGHATIDLDVDEDGEDDPNLEIFEDTSTEFVLNFGGGVERRLTDRVAFRGDLRYFFGADLVPDFWRLSGGLTFGFGR
jgi:opacity protein-like surface antigen